MKNLSLAVVVTVLLFSFKSNNEITMTNGTDQNSTISLSGAFALYPMAVRWAAEYKKSHPNVRIDISAGGAGKGMTDVLSGMVDIGMVSREINPQETKQGAFSFAVTKDAVVPTISTKNPSLASFQQTGFRKNNFASIFVTGTVKFWNRAKNGQPASPIHVFTRSDACGAGETWAKYFGKKQEDLLGVGVFGDPGLATAIKNDPLAIGYNNIGYAYDAKTRKLNSGIAILPIDLNNNGKLDTEENFYGTIDELVNAIATGKYPSPPARDLYFVTKGKPTNPVVIDFIKWVLTDGQKYIQESGYINLSNEKLQVELNKLK